MGRANEAYFPVEHLSYIQLSYLSTVVHLKEMKRQCPNKVKSVPTHTHTHKHTHTHVRKIFLEGIWRSEVVTPQFLTSENGQLHAQVALAGGRGEETPVPSEFET